MLDKVTINGKQYEAVDFRCANAGELMYSHHSESVLVADVDMLVPRLIVRPIPPKQVPLGPEDQIDWVRHKECSDRYRVLSVFNGGITWGSSSMRSSFSELQDRYEYSNDHGKTWQACSKPA